MRLLNINCFFAYLSLTGGNKGRFFLPCSAEVASRELDLRCPEFMGEAVSFVAPTGEGLEFIRCLLLALLQIEDNGS